MLKERKCSIEGCDAKHYARDMCDMHYRRVRRGIPIHGRAPRELWKVDRVTGCWLWVARVDKDGYGVIDRKGRGLRAHRWTYENHVDTIPDGMTVDHLCFNRRCVNPAHLRLLGHAENARRQRKAMKTHCVNGHAFTADNTRFREVGAGVRRECRVCARERAKSRLVRKLAP